jgi:hypothetical protein
VRVAKRQKKTLQTRSGQDTIDISEELPLGQKYALPVYSGLASACFAALKSSGFDDKDEIFDGADVHAGSGDGMR